MRELVVILPTIDTGDWFRSAVLSVLADDSVDSRLLIAYDGVAPLVNPAWESDPRVTWVHSESRRGLVGTLAAAIASTDEPFIARLDADDVSLPGRFGKQLRVLRESEATMLVGGEGTRINAAGQPIGPFGAAVGVDIRHSLLERNRMIHSTVMFRRSAYESVGGYDTRLPQMEDYELWLRLASLGPVASVGEPLVLYRLHGDQISRQARPFGIHMTMVRRRRWELARELKVSKLHAATKDIAWTGAQFLRYYGIRRPGYDRQSTAQ